MVFKIKINIPTSTAIVNINSNITKHIAIIPIVAFFMYSYILVSDCFIIINVNKVWEISHSPYFYLTNL